ncbi:MAG TPA: guanylate kinase [Aeromicrobium sp.]|nr:guanylate kinase [Aeromicrobium sp.]
MVVLAGPTAVGKGTVAGRVRADYPEVWVSVSVTTRPPRPGERGGVDYVFVDDAEFDRLIASGDLLEWAEVHGAARYGTRRSDVEEHLSAGRPVLLEIDVQGARQVRETMPEALLVFLAPPSMEELERRLVGRGTEDAEQRARRLSTAEAEMAAVDEFDVTIVNDDVATAARQLVDFLRFGTSADGHSRDF